MEHTKYEKFFEKLNKDVRVHHFLESTPYSTDPKFRIIDEALFFEHFFSDSEQAREAKEEFEEPANQYKQIALCLGYKGCGKSTFTHWLVKDKDTVVFDFDEYIKDRETIQVNIIRELTKMILSDYTGGAKVLNTFLDIFCSDQGNNQAITTEFPDSQIFSFFDMCMDFVTATFNKEPDNQAIAALLKGFELQELLTVLVYWQIARKTVDKSLSQRTYILFDNLDVVRSSEELDKFLMSFAELVNNVIWAMRENIWYEEWGEIIESNSEVFGNFVFFFSLRETTYSKISTHVRSRVFKRPDLFYFDVSTMFQRNKFVIQRRTFLADNADKLKTESGKRLLTGVDRIYDLLEDTYFWKNVFPFFNNDYRTIIDALVTATEHWDGFEKALDLLQTSGSVEQYVTLRYGGRCAFLRKIYDVFAQPPQEYFMRIESRRFGIEQDADGKKVNMSLAHLLLCYLYDEVDAEDLRKDEYRLDKRSVPLGELFAYFERFARLEDVVNVLYEMYLLRGSDYWSHPVTFDNLGSTPREDLTEFLSKYRNGRTGRDVNEPKIRISCTGRLCLKDLFVRFEYFAARSQKGPETKPLFLCTEKIENEYEFTPLINAVYREVKTCYSEFETYYNEVVIGKLNMSLQRYLKSKLSYKARRYKAGKAYVYEGDHTQVLHSEQVVFSCFGYLEFFRNYFLSTISDLDEKTLANELLVQSSVRFLALIKDAIDEDKVVSDSAKITISELYGYIGLIEKSEYTDFTTRIETRKNMDE